MCYVATKQINKQAKKTIGMFLARKKALIWTKRIKHRDSLWKKREKDNENLDL